MTIIYHKIYKTSHPQSYTRDERLITHSSKSIANTHSIFNNDDSLTCWHDQQLHLTCISSLAATTRPTFLC